MHVQQTLVLPSQMLDLALQRFEPGSRVVLRHGGRLQGHCISTRRQADA
ncbi:hypothetical protein [Polyangium fumosum]|nr:hypothetical protein [Polyangium fumosum]